MTTEPPNAWFEVVEGDDLRQGDILRDCPIPEIAGLEAWPFGEGHRLAVDVGVGDACVLSQSCDLENEKVREVVLGHVVDWPAAQRKLVEQGNTFARSTEFRKTLIAGNGVGIALLRKHDVEPKMNWSIVDFHRLFVLPREAVVAVAKANGPRLRLVPPYREHLGQTFARYFMRVGMPLDAREFETEGKLAS